MNLEKIRTIIADQLSIGVDEIKENVSFEELGIDSLDIFEIVMSLEEEFNIEIPNEDIEDIKTLKELSDYIDRKVK